MDEPKIALPSWLPWAAVACLAAAVACVSELWLVERSRLALAREEADLAKAALRASENQREAERILSAHEVANARALGFAAGGFRIAALQSPTGPEGGPSGIILWRPSDQRTIDLHFSGLEPAGPGRTYRLWFLCSASEPEDCGVFTEAPSRGMQIRLSTAIVAGSRFALVSDPEGLFQPSSPVFGSSSIVLASLPIQGGNSDR
jgi:hypothetical protein